MSVYDDRLETLRELARQALDAVVDVGSRDNQPYGQAVNRLERVVGYAIAALDVTEGDLIAEALRNELTAHLSGFNQWGEDHQARAQAIAANAEPWADALLTMLARLPVARGQDFAQLASDAASNYQRLIRERLKALDAGFEAAQTRIEQVAAEADAERTAISERVEQMGSSFVNRLAEFDQTLANERGLIDQTKTTQAETFRTAQNERDAAFKAAMEQSTHEIGALLSGARDEVETRVAEIRRMESESAALVGAIGLVGTAERYGEEVKEQRKAADIWRVITILLGALAAVAVVVVAITLGHNPKWEDFIGKLTASALIGGIAAYAARQSARHREREERARNFQLELTAFGPFIEPLSGDQKEEERVVMTRKTFGKANVEISADEEPGPHPLSGLLRRKESGPDA